MNQNLIITDEFSNPDSEMEYLSDYPLDAKARANAEQCWQCGGCSYFSPFTTSYGLCHNQNSRHYLETVFEHFTCAVIDIESWEYHSFGAGEITTEIPENELDANVWEAAKNAVLALKSHYPDGESHDAVKLVYRVLDNKVKFVLEKKF